MVRKPCVYQNLSAQMFVLGISITDLAERTYIEYKALCKKLNGTSSVSVEEAIAIHEALDRCMPMEKLFERQ